MKIAIQSSVFLPTPAPGAGALEYLVAELAPRLQRRGHDVTLYAAQGSDVPGVNVVTVPPFRSPWQTEQAIIDRMERTGRPEVLFDHSRYQLAQARWPALAAVTMIHGNAALEKHARNLVFVSRAHGRTFGISDPVALHVSIDVGAFKVGGPMPDRGPALWMGRIMPYKRPHLALELCRQAGQWLTLAGPIVDEPYFDEYVRPRLGPHSNATWVGEVRGEQWRGLLSTSSCLLMTSEPQEPAGLVMLEAMASGTPVFAFRQGAALEYVRPAVSGFLWPNEATFVESLRLMGWREIDPAACRRHVEEHFSLDAMAAKAEAMLAQVADGGSW